VGHRSSNLGPAPTDPPSTLGATELGQAITVRPAGPEDFPAIAALMVECFPREFRLLFGNRLEAASAVVEEVLRFESGAGLHAFAAQGSASVVGMLLLESAHRTRITERWAAMWRIARYKVGLCYVPRLLLGIALPSYDARPAEAYIGAIGVTSGARGRGAGTRLLQAAETWARDNHMRRLGLHVSSGNPGARTLYRRVGFRERSEETHLLASLLLGQPAIIYMAKDLEDSP